ncbi:valyl-tRNA synthetase [Candidatus Nitromaritima sp. SCGC AAA799-C22]|nr:valyl-tRNA synthetase [Candidatus Nitromaritima sp. SCGC AAA799-C22]
MAQLEKIYSPKEVEERWNRYWHENRLYHGDENSTRDPFSIVIPPPNVTGSLHIGHAFNNTLQDILARWKRMLGFATLWQPGTDHAGIATQNVVERQLHAEGTNRQDLGREEFIKRIWKWREESGGAINHQLSKLGASLDWDRDRFTMDEGLSKAVREVFVSLYEEGLIYKGDYIINWCPRCHTALSDLEVEYHETQGHLYHIKYAFKEGGNPLTIATTRPETLLGDTAVAVNPEDERYQGLIGKTLLLPVLGRELPLIGDRYVDISFGSGALKVTPAHDPNDFELGRRHELDLINVMNPDGTMNEEAGSAYQGMDRFACREQLVTDLKEQDLLVNIEDHLHSVGHCYRCRTVVEPCVSKQWFVKAKPLAAPAIEAVKNGSIRIVPKFWENTYFEWMENIRDWCISRQIWWGHQIPAWHCSACGKMTVVRETPTACSYCGAGDLTQESDVLDTWFSSALWPFSTLGWPEQTPTLKKFYPTSVLCTGFDILFFWVARMIMMGLKFMGEVPFRDVYIHALIRDAEGQKMSKTKGNVIDPLVMMEKYGTDALRFTLAAFAAQGRDIKLAEDRIEGYRNFCNKLWNASRFVLMNLDDYKGTCELAANENRHAAHRWILSRLNSACGEVNRALEEFKFNDAASTIYKFIWNEYCDWFIELSKPHLYGGEDREATQNVLVHVLESSLRLLHPFMPFITEEIRSKLPVDGGSLMTASFPIHEKSKADPDVEETLSIVINIITSVRNIRGEMNLNPGLNLELLVRTERPEQAEILELHSLYINTLARVKLVESGPDVAKPKVSASSVWDGMDIFVPLEGKMDFAEEKKRIEKELKKIEKDIIVLDKKLSNRNFIDKAPPEVIEKDNQRKQTLSEKQTRLKVHLETIDKALS